MKKRIIIDMDNNSKPIKNNPFIRLVQNKFFEWILYMIGYAIVLIVVSCLFNKIPVSNCSIISPFLKCLNMQQSGISHKMQYLPLFSHSERRYNYFNVILPEILFVSVTPSFKVFTLYE